MNNNLLWNKYYRILVQYPEDYLAEFENGRAYEAIDIHRPYSEQVFSFLKKARIYVLSFCMLDTYNMEQIVLKMLKKLYKYIKN